MTYQEIASMIAAVGVPYAYYQFPENTAQEPPFICFFFPRSADFYADDTPYFPKTELVIELYTDNKDFALESAVERVLIENGLAWTREEEYLDSERMFVQVYTMTIALTKE